MDNELFATIAHIKTIAEPAALPASIENDLEERGFIRQTDAPYASLTEAGDAIRDASVATIEEIIGSIEEGNEHVARDLHGEVLVDAVFRLIGTDPDAERAEPMPDGDGITITLRRATALAVLTQHDVTGSRNDGWTFPDGSHYWQMDEALMVALSSVKAG